MRLLELLERIGEMPAEVWLIPPIVIIALMIAVWWLRRSCCFGAIARSPRERDLTVVRKILNPSEIRGRFRGRELVMHIIPRRRRTFRRRWTRVTVDVKNPEVIGLSLWPQDVLDRLIMAAGGTEVRVGDDDVRSPVRRPVARREGRGPDARR